MFYKYKPKPWSPEDTRKEYFSIPEVKPMSVRNGLLLFGGVTLIGVGIGAAIGTYVFFGVVTLAGLIALVESNKHLKYMVYKGNKLLDICIFGATIYATAALGVTVAASLTIAGLGYTIVYAPWLRQRINNNKNNNNE